MPAQEGPAFGAGIIGISLGGRVWTQTYKMLLSLCAGLGVAVLDYFFLIWMNIFTKKP